MNITNPHPIIILLLVIWSLFWKGYALWKSAKNDQIRWFLAILIINTVGILPIIYLKFFQEQKLKENKNCLKRGK